MYDSTQSTLEHIESVQLKLRTLCNALTLRGIEHDKSKLSPVEKKAFDKYTPLLKHSTFGSAEYEEYRAGLGIALDHHYQANRHHPEHHNAGIYSMNILDVVEMLCDWVAAAERHSDGSPYESFRKCKDRFNVDKQLFAVLENSIPLLLDRS